MKKSWMKLKICRYLYTHTRTDVLVHAGGELCEDGDDEHPVLTRFRFRHSNFSIEVYGLKVSSIEYVCVFFNFQFGMS